VPYLTTFELMTALSFLYFERQNVNAAVVEVGLGGRLDATNVVEPIVSVITSISLDHVQFLGDTLAKISVEKAGIIKNGVPVVLSPQKDEARQVIVRIAAERNASLIEVGRDYKFAGWSHNLEKQALILWQAGEQDKVDEFLKSSGKSAWKPIMLTIPLLGYHQVENAATAYTALQVAKQQGLTVPDDAIKTGFESVKWPGRFEVLRQRPPVIVDSAHNQDSAQKLKRAIDEYLPDYPVILLFGASEDKDVKGMFTELLPRVEKVIVTESVHPRAMNAVELGELVKKYAKPAQIILPLEEALKTALKEAGRNKAVIAAGSLFIAGAVLETWAELSEEEKSPASKEKST